MGAEWVVTCKNMQATKFNQVPIGNQFLLGSLHSRHALLTFKKVSDSFAECDEYKGNTYYLYPEQEVYITLEAAKNGSS